MPCRARDHTTIRIPLSLAGESSLPLGTGQGAWNCETHSGREVVQSPPAVEREELVVRRCANLTTKARPELEHRLPSGCESIGNKARLQPPGVGIHGEYAKTRSPSELPDRAVDALVREVHAGFAGETA